MGHRIRQRDAGLIKSRFLRFEPLELRLQFAVDYSPWAPVLLPAPAVDLAVYYAPAVHGTIVDVSTTNADVFPNADEFSSFDTLFPLSASGWSSAHQMWGYASPDRGQILDDVFDESWLDGYVLSYTDAYEVYPQALSDAVIGDSELARTVLPDVDPWMSASSQAWVGDEGTWIGLAAPLRESEFIVGATTEFWVTPSALLRHGPTESAILVGGEVVYLVTQEMETFSLIAATSLPAQTPSASSLEVNPSSANRLFVELATLNFMEAHSNLQPRETVVPFVSLGGYAPASASTYYAASGLSEPTSMPLELDDQLPIDKPAISHGTITRTREPARVREMPSEIAISQTTNVVLAMGMLPVGMLPIGSEPVNVPARHSRHDADLHFMVQTALICESLSSVPGPREQDIGEPTAVANYVELASTVRPKELLVAGFTLFVLQARSLARSQKSLGLYWKAYASRLHRT